MTARLLDLILANVRTPEEREGDLLAQMHGDRRGEQRLLELAAKYGTAQSCAATWASCKNYSERMMRAAIRRLPPGQYRFEDFLDNDGISERPVKIAATVTIHGDRASDGLHAAPIRKWKVGERQLRGGGFGRHLCVSLPGARRYSVHRGRHAAVDE